ncbi:MAG: hypothetical protein K8T91_08120 [Planctomycetes bacterium]|nr:hypothetical protein [Planctomycetota bacterium]
MHSPHTVRLWADDEAYVAPPEVVLFQLVRSREPSDPLRRAIARSRQALLARQQPDGSFAESQPLDPGSLATLVLSTAFLESHEPAQFRPFARGLLEAQRADGGWAAGNSGPLDLSATVLAYFALKLSGQSPASEPMVCARRAILSRGGATQIDPSAQVWLALLGQMPYERVDGIPSLEKLLLRQLLQRNQGQANLFPMDTSILCQAILAALRPRRHIATGCGIRELFLAAPRLSSNTIATLSRWCRKRNLLPLRKRALDAARRILLLNVQSWASEAQDCQPTPDTAAWALVALDALGFTADTGPRQATSLALQSQLDTETDTPLLSARSGTSASLALAALRASGLDDQHQDVRLGLSWLHGREPQTTSEVAQRLLLLTAPQPSAAALHDVLPPPLQACGAESCDESIDDYSHPTQEVERLAQQLLAAQRTDGTWSELLSRHRVGAEHYQTNTSATALAVMALASIDKKLHLPALRRAVSWLRTRQQPKGSWPACGSEGAVAVTSRVLRALIATGTNKSDEAIIAGAHWLMAHQQSDGGWGDAGPGQVEAIAGEGPATPRTTAAALLGLLAAGRSDGEAVARGAEYLVSSQSRCGDWVSPSTGSFQDVTPGEGSLLDTAEGLLALGCYAARPRDSESEKRPQVRVIR